MKVEIGKEYYLIDNSYSQDLSNGGKVTVNNGGGLAGFSGQEPVKVKIITDAFKINLRGVVHTTNVIRCRIVAYQNKKYLVMDRFHNSFDDIDYND